MLFWIRIKRTGCRGIVRRNPCLCPVLGEGRGEGRSGARVYKISRDEQGSRLTHLKILSGILKVKDTISGKQGEEKVNQIRIYSGSKYETVSQAEPGCICAVTGLDGTWAGQAIGEAAEGELPLLEPVLTYQIRLPEGCDAHVALLKLRQLEEEEPELHIVWNETLGEIQAQVMGQVQIEILKRLIADRFGMEVEFGAGSIVYKETIAEPVEGVAILSLCATMRRSICGWSRENGAVVCSLRLTAVKICWIGTGRG